MSRIRTPSTAWRPIHARPVVGITVDVEDRAGRPRANCSLAYAKAVADAGGMPILLPPIVEHVGEHLRHCRALVLTGGDDPRMEEFGRPTHAKAVPVHEQRQAYEVALLRLVRERAPAMPVLGVCLGMQLMALVDGGDLEQYLPEAIDSADRHWDRLHDVVPSDDDAVPSQVRIARGPVHSRHKQAVHDPGELLVLARAPDGLIEAVAHPHRPFYLGVQWHPERTADPILGQGLFSRLIAAIDS